MLRLNQRQREILTDKVPDVVNLVSAAIVIGFLIGQPGVSLDLFVGSVALWIVALVFVLFIGRDV